MYDGVLMGSYMSADFILVIWMWFFTYRATFLPESSQLGETTNYSLIMTKAVHSTMTILKCDHGYLYKYFYTVCSLSCLQESWEATLEYKTPEVRFVYK